MSEPVKTPDPFDPSSLRLDQSFADGEGVKKLLLTVPVRKPKRQDFVRVHPDAAYRATGVGIIELRDEQETYLVSRAVAGDLEREFTLVTLFLAINRQGVLFLWPVKLPGHDGKHNEWHRSAGEAAASSPTCRLAPMRPSWRRPISPTRPGLIGRSPRS